MRKEWWSDITTVNTNGVFRNANLLLITTHFLKIYKIAIIEYLNNTINMISSISKWRTVPFQNQLNNLNKESFSITSIIALSSPDCHFLCHILDSIPNNHSIWSSLTPNQWALKACNSFFSSHLHETSDAMIKNYWFTWNLNITFKQRVQVNWTPI